MTDRLGPAPHRLSVAPPSPVARRAALVVAWLVVVVALTVLLLRFPPADALGALAEAASVSTGVVLLSLAALLFSASLLVGHDGPARGVRRVSLVLGGMTLVLGLLSL
ncbi:hypothetical protein AB0O90_11295 [Microbacterium testaceum]|uniref:hypothetical protein n=1 Tax=Microbacterium testaceum TaxID=2033 RepID=UPI0034173894